MSDKQVTLILSEEDAMIVAQALQSHVNQLAPCIGIKSVEDWLKKVSRIKNGILDEIIHHNNDKKSTHGCSNPDCNPGSNP